MSAFFREVSLRVKFDQSTVHEGTSLLLRCPSVFANEINFSITIAYAQVRTLDLEQYDNTPDYSALKISATTAWRIHIYEG